MREAGAAESAQQERGTRAGRPRRAGGAAFTRQHIQNIERSARVERLNVLVEGGEVLHVVLCLVHGVGDPVIELLPPLEHASLI